MTRRRLVQIVVRRLNTGLDFRLLTVVLGTVRVYSSRPQGKSWKVKYFKVTNMNAENLDVVLQTQYFIVFWTKYSKICGAETPRL